MSCYCSKGELLYYLLALFFCISLQYICIDGTEISLSKVCDFIVDCPDKDDEMICGDCTFEFGKCMIVLCHYYFLYHVLITTLTLNQWNTCSSKFCTYQKTEGIGKLLQCII